MNNFELQTNLADRKAQMTSLSVFRHCGWVACSLAVWLTQSAPLSAQDPLESILKIERGGKGVAQAHAAAEKLAQSGISLDAVFKKAATANPVAKNWLLAIAGSMVDKQGKDKSKPTLDKVLADQTADGEIRYWVLDRIAGNDVTAREKLLDGRIDDASLDIRFEAIQQAVKKLPSIDAAKNDEQLKKEAIAGYQQLLKASRQHVQINYLADQLKELGIEVDRLKHFGFISQWQVVGPFENRQGVGFPIAYEPEDQFARSGQLDIKKTYKGKDQNAEVAWQAATTDKPDGTVDLNPVFLNEKGAVVYAYTNIDSPADMNCQVRFGTPNANKIWINGKEVTSNNVYHTGAQIDQYITPVELKKGANTVLLKLCQNEQTEAWAQDYSFMLRFTDFTGATIQ